MTSPSSPEDETHLKKLVTVGFFLPFYEFLTDEMLLLDQRITANANNTNSANELLTVLLTNQSAWTVENEEKHTNQAATGKAVLDAALEISVKTVQDFVESPQMRDTIAYYIPQVELAELSITNSYPENTPNVTRFNANNAGHNFIIGRFLDCTDLVGHDDGSRFYKVKLPQPDSVFLTT